MKVVAPAIVIISLVMMCFTDPQGFAVWVDRNQVVSVARPIGCADGANAKISTGGDTFLCVRESVRDAVRRLDGLSPVPEK